MCDRSRFLLIPFDRGDFKIVPLKLHGHLSILALSKKLFLTSSAWPVCRLIGAIGCIERAICVRAGLRIAVGSCWWLILKLPHRQPRLLRQPLGRCPRAGSCPANCSAQKPVVKRASACCPSPGLMDAAGFDADGLAPAECEGAASGFAD